MVRASKYTMEWKDKLVDICMELVEVLTVIYKKKQESEHNEHGREQNFKSSQNHYFPT